MIRRLVVALGVVLCAVPAAAQSVEFMPRTGFHLTAEHLAQEDERFVWDVNFGGDLDVVDYRHGRAGVYANYQAILGEEFRAFDPNQGNYTLGASASARLARLETAFVFHHVSRHLSDRGKDAPIDWNMIGARVATTFEEGPLRTDVRADLRTVVTQSFVDYSWEIDGVLKNAYRLRPGTSFVSSTELRVLGTDGSGDRGTQTGFRAEGGVRFDGRAGAIELFVAGERRIDPDPLAFGTITWFSAGFKLLSR